MIVNRQPIEVRGELTMRYETDHRSRTRAIAVYGAIVCVGAALGFLVRAGVITEHILW